MSRARPTFRGGGTHSFRGEGQPPACSGWRGLCRALALHRCRGDHRSPVFRFLRDSNRQSGAVFRATCGRPYKNDVSEHNLPKRRPASPVKLPVMPQKETALRPKNRAQRCCNDIILREPSVRLPLFRGNAVVTGGLRCVAAHKACSLLRGAEGAEGRSGNTRTRRRFTALRAGS